MLRTNSYNKTPICSDDILDLGPEPLAGLRHGVLCEGLHHLPVLRDQVLGLIVKLCSGPQFRDAPCKIVYRAAVWGAGRPDLLLPHLHEVLFEPILRPLAVVGRVACALCGGLCLAVTYLALIILPVSADPPEAINSFELPYIIANWVLIEVSIALSLILSTSGAKSGDYPGSCSSLFIHLYRKVSVCFCLWFGKQLRQF